MRVVPKKLACHGHSPSCDELPPKILSVSSVSGGKSLLNLLLIPQSELKRCFGEKSPRHAVNHLPALTGLETSGMVKTTSIHLSTWWTDEHLNGFLSTIGTCIAARKAKWLEKRKRFVISENRASSSQRPSTVTVRSERIPKQRRAHAFLGQDRLKKTFASSL